MRTVTLKCVLGTCDTEEGLEASMRFDMLISTTHSHLFFLPVIREMAPLVARNQLHKFLGNADFCITPRIWGNGVWFPPDSCELSFVLVVKLRFCSRSTSVL